MGLGVSPCTHLPGSIDHRVVLREGLAETVRAGEELVDADHLTGSLAALDLVGK